ncbi:MAG: transposase [Oligoflexia bacterium]|nr:transposase [Oligoflexia bacterium]
MQKGQKLPHKIRILSSKKPVHIVITSKLKISLQGQQSIRMLQVLIRDVFNRYGVDIFQFYIQKTHIHFFVTTVRADLISTAMMYLNSKLALFFNKLFSRKGTFWSDRYFSSIKKSAAEIIRTIHYIATQCKFRSPFDDVNGSIGLSENYPWGIPGMVLSMVGVGKTTRPEVKLLDIIESAIFPYRR